MTTPERLPGLIRYLEWANRRVCGALEAQRGALSERVLRWAAHIAAAERVWLDRIGSATTEQAPWPDWDLDETIRRLERSAFELAAMAGGGNPDRDVEYRTTKGVPYTTSLVDILHHLVIHGAYHRGQIGAALREEGFEPINTDYITFVREGGTVD